jgi:hypothetical protein
MSTVVRPLLPSTAAVTALCAVPASARMGQGARCWMSFETDYSRNRGFAYIDSSTGFVVQARVSRRSGLTWLSQQIMAKG